MRPASKEEIARRLKEARKNAGFENQAAFAEHLGVMQSAVSAWETGMYKPRIELWERVAEALQTTVSDLFFELPGGGSGQVTD